MIPDITGILGFIKSIYYAVANVGTVLEILFRYLGQFFNFIGYTLNTFVGKYIAFLPSSLATVLVSLLILLLVLKVVGRE